MRAYSRDLRERLVRAVAEGQPMSVAARRFDVTFITVKRMVPLQQHTGAVAPRPIPGGIRAIGPAQAEVLRARLAAEPDATVLEQCAWWAEQQGPILSEATMWRAVRRLGGTHKKNRGSKRKACGPAHGVACRPRQGQSTSLGLCR